MENLEKLKIHLAHIEGIVDHIKRKHLKQPMIISEILTIVKNRDRWDKELTAKVNYNLLQQRFKLIESKLEDWKENG